MQSNKKTRWCVAILIAALSMLAAACASDASDPADDAAAPPQSAEAAGDGATDRAASDDATADEVEADAVEDQADADADDAPEAEPLVLGEADWDQLTAWNLPALGGVRFGVPESAVVHHDADMITIRPSFSPDSGRYDPTVVISRVFASGTQTPLTVDRFVTTAIQGLGTAEPTNRTLSMFGETLDGWRFTGRDGRPLGPHYVYSAYPAGGSGPSAWQPFPRAEIFLAEVPGGVLAIGWIGSDDEAMVEARELFDLVAPSASLERPLAESADPVDPLILDEPSPPSEPVDIPEEWPAPLAAVSSPIESGPYSHAGFGTAFRFDVPAGWWVQPNFPSWLILSADDSFGPGDRALTFRSGVDHLLPSVRSGDAGDGVPFDLRAIAADPPPGIEILSSGDIDLGGAEGFRVALQFDDETDCAGGEICEYMITTRYPFPPGSLRMGYSYELWYLDGGLAEPILIYSETPDASWQPAARELVESIVFAIDGS